MEALPCSKVSRFHVEHTPIEKPSAPDRTLLDQLVDTRLNRFDREGRTQLREGADALTTKPADGLSFSVFNPDRRPNRSAPQFAADAKLQLVHAGPEFRTAVL